MVANNIENPGKTTLTPSTLTERVETNNRWQAFNADTRFSPDSNTNFEALAAIIFPEDPQHPHNTELKKSYEAALTRNLAGQLKDGNIENFWKWLQEQNCTNVKVESGSLAFYSTKGQIDIGSQCKPLQIEARSDYTIEKEETEERIKKFTQGQLSALRTEIETSRPA